MPKWCSVFFSSQNHHYHSERCVILSKIRCQGVSPAEVLLQWQVHLLICSTDFLSRCVGNTSDLGVGKGRTLHGKVLLLQCTQLLQHAFRCLKILLASFVQVPCVRSSKNLQDMSHVHAKQIVYIFTSSACWPIWWLSACALDGLKNFSHTGTCMLQV